MEGPSILPPQQCNESALLWELSTAFRHAVLLEARPELYKTEYVETSLSDPNERDDDVGRLSERTSEAYRFSTYGVSRQQAQDEKLDGWIEELLLKGQEEESTSDDETQSTIQDDDQDDAAAALLENLLSSPPNSNETATVDENDDDSNQEVTEIESDIIAELSQIQTDSNGFFSRIQQRWSKAGKILRKDLVKTWRRVEGNLDDMFEEELDEEIASHIEEDGGCSICPPTTKLN